jgi:hypothetical protein
MKTLEESEIKTVNGGTLNGALCLPGRLPHPPGTAFPLPIRPPITGGPIHTPPLI